MQELKSFSESTALKANPAKCKVYCGGMNTSEIQKLLHITGFSVGSLSFKYIGVPLSRRRLNIHKCRPLIDKNLEKIKHWTSRLLSHVGRYQLI